MLRRPGDARWAQTANRRRFVLASATAGLGLMAHVLGGGGVSLSCLPLIAAAVAGVLFTLLADRISGYQRRASLGMIGLVGGGQLAMHLSLNASLPGHAAAEHVGLGLTCGLVVTHAISTGVLIGLMLGLPRLLELPVALLARASAWFWPGWYVVLVPVDHVSDAVTTTSPAPAGTDAVRMDYYGPVRPRRGPPVLALANR
ncbi:MAG TPA: hypothetical protein VGH89_14455 [Pseudonocardia sp.]|jgi:hypothetical protein